MKLYYTSGACSFAVHALLNECGADYETQRVEMSAGDNKKPEFLKLNSRGQIPVLVDGDSVLREGAAILMYVADKFKSPMIPQSGAERQAALEWMMFCNSTLHPAYGACFFIARQTVDADAKASIMAAAEARVQMLWDDVEAQLNKTTYIAGANITVADLMLCTMANWLAATQPKFGPKTIALIKNVTARPSYKAALATEEVTYKAAA
jgi:glutathione S-transferase